MDDLSGLFFSLTTLLLMLNVRRDSRLKTMLLMLLCGKINVKKLIRLNFLGSIANTWRLVIKVSDHLFPLFYLNVTYFCLRIF